MSTSSGERSIYTRCHLRAVSRGGRQECSEESWLLELVALLLYHDPTVSLSNLRLLTERVVALRGGEVPFPVLSLLSLSLSSLCFR